MALLQVDLDLPREDLVQEAEAEAEAVHPPWRLALPTLQRAVVVAVLLTAQVRQGPAVLGRQVHREASEVTVRVLEQSVEVVALLQQTEPTPRLRRELQEAPAQLRLQEPPALARQLQSAQAAAAAARQLVHLAMAIVGRGQAVETAVVAQLRALLDQDWIQAEEEMPAVLHNSEDHQALAAAVLTISLPTAQRGQRVK